MGIRDSRILNEVHPWLRVRLKWLAEVARIIGSGQSLISGNRSREEQQTLFDTVVDRPVAAPGCSQHQYGFAVDATYLPSFFVTTKGRPMTAPNIETNRFMEEAAHSVNLTTVRKDPGHLQIYPGAQFKSWAVARGFCNPNQVQGLAVQRLLAQAAQDDFIGFISELDTLLNQPTFRSFSR